MPFRIRTEAYGGPAASSQSLRYPPDPPYYRYVPAARRKSKKSTPPYLHNQSPDGDGSCTTTLTAFRTIYSNVIQSRKAAVTPLTFRPAYLLNQWSKEGPKHPKMTAATSSIHCAPFQPYSTNRLRAVGGEIARICPRRAVAAGWRRRQAHEGPVLVADRSLPLPSTKPVPSSPGPPRHCPYRDGVRAAALTSV